MSITVKGSVQVSTDSASGWCVRKSLAGSQNRQGTFKSGEVEFSDCCFLDGHGTASLHHDPWCRSPPDA